jgi:hypothetical protein
MSAAGGPFESCALCAVAGRDTYCGGGEFILGIDCGLPCGFCACVCCAA